MDYSLQRVAAAHTGMGRRRGSRTRHARAFPKLRHFTPQTAFHANLAEGLQEYRTVRPTVGSGDVHKRSAGRFMFYLENKALP